MRSQFFSHIEQILSEWSQRFERYDKLNFTRLQVNRKKLENGEFLEVPKRSSSQVTENYS